MNDRLPPMRTRPNSPAVLWLAGLLCLPEIVFFLAEFGGLNLRNWAVLNFGFWNVLLAGAQPLWPLQREAMFVTYALLHGGWFHLLGNVVVTLALAGIVVARSSERGFLVLFALGAIGGGLGYAALGPQGAPMVGASGAVFALLGAWKYWEWLDRRAFGVSMQPLWLSVAALALLNVVIFVWLDGLLAWEAHLGGAIAGALWAAVVSPPGPRR